MCEPRLSPPCAPLRFFLNVKYLTITFCVPQYCIPQVQVLSTYFLDPADSVRCPTLPASAPILRFFTHQASYHHLLCPSVLHFTGPNIVHVLAISCCLRKTPHSHRLFPHSPLFHTSSISPSHFVSLSIAFHRSKYCPRTYYTLLTPSDTPLSPPLPSFSNFPHIKCLTITCYVPQYCIPQVQILSTYLLYPADLVRHPTLTASAPFLHFFTHQASYQYHHLLCPSVLHSTGPSIVHVLPISC